MNACSTQAVGKAPDEVAFQLVVSSDRFRSRAETRAFAEAILAFVDRIEGATGADAPVLDDRGQVAALGDYRPLNP